MSSGRSRSGGMWIGRTLRRNNRSSRNWPCIEAFARSLLVAAITRTSTVTGFSPPSRSITPDSKTRSSFAWASGPRSPTSSRNSVPPSASSKRPTRRSVAPVKAPRSCPNISDSTRSFGMAALLTHEQPFGRERLLEKLERAELGGAHRVGQVGLAAHHDDGHVRGHALQLLQRREPVGAARHHQVEQHGVRRAALHRRQGGGPVPRF